MTVFSSSNHSVELQSVYVVVFIVSGGVRHPCTCCYHRCRQVSQQLSLKDHHLRYWLYSNPVKSLKIERIQWVCHVGFSHKGEKMKSWYIIFASNIVHWDVLGWLAADCHPCGRLSHCCYSVCNKPMVTASSNVRMFEPPLLSICQTHCAEID